MKLLSTLIFVLFIAFSYASRASTDFSINQQTQLSDLKGQVVYIDFWASWCKPCRASFPWMNTMQEKYASQGLQIVAINLDEEKDDADYFLSKLAANFTLVFDPQGNIASQYELVGMPSSYLIDKTGKLRIIHQGFFESKQDIYEQEIQALLAE